MSKKNVTMIVDLQYGSTGKGMVANYIANSPDEKHFDVVISANMPNAGHTSYSDKGEKFVHKVLPSGVLSEPDFILIGPGAVFSIDRLRQEISNLRDCGYCKDTAIRVHSCATVLTDDMVSEEVHSGLTKIASTTSGAMAAQVAKMMRNPDAKVVAKHYAMQILDAGAAVINNKSWMTITSMADNILAEGAQGYSLGINQDFYPFTTSRDCSPARFLSDMALPYDSIEEVIGVARTFPIRVGNHQGFSGPHYGDQREITWEELGQPPEITTVTGRVRRVFTFSNEQFCDALYGCAPNRVFLNFANYLRPRERGLIKEVAAMCELYDAKLAWLGYGPLSSEVVKVD